MMMTIVKINNAPAESGEGRDNDNDDGDVLGDDDDDMITIIVMIMMIVMMIVKVSNAPAKSGEGRDDDDVDGGDGAVVGEYDDGDADHIHYYLPNLERAGMMTTQATHSTNPEMKLLKKKMVR